MDGLTVPGTIDRFVSAMNEDRISVEPTARLRSVLIGNETLLVECADMLQRNGHEIVAVVAGQGAAAGWARRAGLPLFGQTAELLTAGLGPIDYLFSITNLSLVPAPVLALPRRAAINFHDGPLPAYAGLNTPVWALLGGERQHGVTWHLMTDAIDAGDILVAEPVDIDEGESALSLNTKCFEAGIRSFALLVKELETGTMRRQPQASAPLRLFGRADRPQAAATIDWQAPAEDIARLVSALDFGTYRNPLGAPKALFGDALLLVQDVALLDSASSAAPGTILEGGDAPVIATGSNDLRILRLVDLDGRTTGLPATAAGDQLATVDADARAALHALDGAAGRYEGWWQRRLAARDALQLPQFTAADASALANRATMERSVAVPSAQALLAVTIAWLGRVADRDQVDIGYADQVHASRLDGVARWFAAELPLRVRLDWNVSLDALADAVAQETGSMHRRVAIAADLIARTPELRGRASFAHPVTVQMVDSLDQATPSAETVLHIAIAANGTACRWSFDPARIDAAAVADLWQGFEAMLAASAAAPEAPIARLSLLDPTEYVRVVREWNAGHAPTSDAAGTHRLFVEQAARTPNARAITSRGVSLTYAELDARSNRMARYLADLGVGPDVLVGLNLERSVDMVVAMLGIHKAGGAYVPLDPAYPRDRLAHMISDSGLAVVVTQASLLAAMPDTEARIVNLDDSGAAIATLSPAPFDGGGRPENLAYVIYTSGSTGLPKGVMVEHRNVLNFFAGMDAKLEADGTWLAVTSLSFDISVLELSWPLTRGYHVVIATEREVRGDVPAAGASATPLDFSLFYFGSADSGSTAEQYRLLLEGARFGDANGFEAVWTPERHFHAFGGLYPNPSVTSAAIAASTSRIKIRAGSVVAPLHHPIRIAEEWALVDNLSNGRVGIAFASGWQPNDFVLNPENFRDRSGALARSMEDVRALWRGEKRSFPGALGHDVAVQVYPRPVQPELPVWITSAGNAATFAAAGRTGAFVLTHLLGQKVEEVAEKIATYRAAWREAGHPGEGHVTLMLHSFVGDDIEQVRAVARQPLIEYLRTSTNLLQQYAWSFPTFRHPEGAEPGDQIELSELSDEETEALLEHAFDRYFETSGLFGTPEGCLELIQRLRRIGVNEIGCLIDFGIPVTTVLDHLPALNRLRQLANPTAGEGGEALPDLMARHGVTHLQCTPSLVQMLASDPAARPQLAALRRLMVGGEAFPPHLARDMTGLVGGAVMNMYGPTETTIWSAVHNLTTEDMVPPLGRPLVNQQIYILDRRFEPTRPGTPGELVIAGDGVVRGYLNRAELTAERFVADPFAPGARAYRTGDLARQRADGTLEFLGRLDHQVKIRGYRIELGEIEARLAAHPGIAEVVVVARGSGAEARLIAYTVARPGAAPTTDELREHLRVGLPEFMVPAHFMLLDALPRTPNGKTDRNALPEPVQQVAAADAEGEGEAEEESPLEAQIQAIWCDVLKLPRVGLRDNFFDLGGHSLLAVQVHRRLAAIAERPLPLTDIFRFPTIAALGAHLSQSDDQPASAQEGLDRARNRRAALQRRGAARALARN